MEIQMFKSRFMTFILISIIPTPILAADNVTELRSTLENQRSVAVTIYNNDLALVKDFRNINLITGLNAVAIRDVSAQIRPETALLRSINAQGSLSLLEPIGGDWQILSESAKYTKVNSQLAQWEIKVPAEGEAKLTYRAIV